MLLQKSMARGDLEALVIDTGGLGEPLEGVNDLIKEFILIFIQLYNGEIISLFLYERIQREVFFIFIFIF